MVSHDVGFTFGVYTSPFSSNPRARSLSVGVFFWRGKKEEVQHTHTLPSPSRPDTPMSRTRPRLSADLCAYALGPFLNERDCENARQALLLDCNRSVLDFRQQNFRVDVIDTFLLDISPDVGPTRSSSRSVKNLPTSGCLTCWRAART